MHRYRSSLIVALVALAFALDFGSILHAQVGKGSIVDVNTAAEKDLLALPHMTPAIVKGIIEKRPYSSIAELNAYLASQSLTVEDVGAVRQGDRQVRRPGRNRPSEAVRVHTCEPEYCER